VTGATGYIAGCVVRRLLEEGLTVHATVRDPSRTERLAHLVALEEENPGALKFFAADLMNQGSFAAAMAGCSVVFHIASPFAMSVEDPQQQLVEPAQLGTRNVLEEVDRTPSVQRVVVTSSCAAIYGDNADVAEAPGGVLTEEVWNTSSSLQHNAYSYSKTVAEKEAWKLHDAQSRWKLVVVNPCMVMGPGVHVHESSESFALLKQVGDGSLSSGVPDIGMGVVDVRDVAEAQLRAAFLPDASGRNILCGHNTSFPEMAETLRETYGDYPLPKRVAPKWLLWLIGPFINKGLTRRYVSRNVGLPWKSDNSKSVRELGMTYRPLAETMNDFFEQIVQGGYVKKP